MEAHFHANETGHRDGEAGSDALRILCDRLMAENARLKRLLDAHHIPYDTGCDGQPEHGGEARPVPDVAEEMGAVHKRSPLAERVALFLSLFSGRQDVYARRWQSRDGRAGYSPACANEWRQGVCGKPRMKCSDCRHAAYLPFDEAAVAEHLAGNQVLGVYPLLPDDTCRFLAIDFDGSGWKKDVQAVAAACTSRGIPFAVEISRSGNGAHLWLFFEGPVPAALARNLGSLLLTQSMQANARLGFSSYDRMFPNQDTLPQGGFGNLIALPFQKSAYPNGGCLFVDEHFQAYPDQWAFLSGVQRIGLAQAETWIAGARMPLLGTLGQDGGDAKPWQPGSKADAVLRLPDALHCILADRLYIPVDSLSQSAQNHIKRLAAFRNPAFYKAQAMRLPVWNKPRVICCAAYVDSCLCLPRGCRDAFSDFARQGGMALTWEDARNEGRPVDVHFRGVLRAEQRDACEALCRYDDGVLSAATAFGKTVVGAALIARRRVNTLVLVHRTQLMQQWKERLEAFLEVRETLPDAPGRRGRKKRREVIGVFGGGKDTRGGIIDIAIMQSMGGEGAVKAWVGEYGMVIVDECHHVPAVSFERVLQAVRAKYVYGLTATPDRQDGHHPIMNMYLGPVRYLADAKSQAANRPFAHLMIPRFTGVRFPPGAAGEAVSINRYYAHIVSDDLRNHLIADDVMGCVREGCSCLVLSERAAHVRTLAGMLSKRTEGVFVLTGGRHSAASAEQLAALRSLPPEQPLVICATGRYIGEGFDLSRLDTLFLTMPISWHGTLA